MVETLGEAWSLGWRIHVRCAAGKHDKSKFARECVYRGELDVETLLCTRGRAFPLALLASRLKCPRCGSVHIAVVFDPPAGGMRHSA